MDSTELLKRITFKLSAVAHCVVGREWNYRNIISSYTRLLLVTEGEASIYIGDKKIGLKKDHLYLIPSFVHCSYLCESAFSHYYAIFTIELPNNLSIHQLFDTQYEIKAEQEHFDYFQKLCDANPNKRLPSKDPKVYQRINSKAWNHSINDIRSSLISSGLLYLLISRFIGMTKINLNKGDASNVLAVIKYIHANLHTELTVAKLAEMSCLSTGHFTRKFKELTEFNPLEYINHQRIEKAQLLLNTTPLSSVEIAEACGYKSGAYFCKIFKKYIGQTPQSYRVEKVVHMD